MISWFLSKNKIRTTTCDELIDIVVTNKDLMYTEGVSNIDGIMFYRHKTSSSSVELSYGTTFLRFSPITRHDGAYHIGMGCVNDCDFLDCRVNKEHVLFKTKQNRYEEVPLSAFDSEVDFFQYTLLNLDFECSDASLIKLIKFFTEFLDEQSK